MALEIQFSIQRNQNLYYNWALPDILFEISTVRQADSVNPRDIAFRSTAFPKRLQTVTAKMSYTPGDVGGLTEHIFKQSLS